MSKPFRNTVVGSYPRAQQVDDTMQRPSWTQEEVDEYIRWAARDQASLGLEVITDGEGYRENMFYFYQRRVDGVTFDGTVKQNFGDTGFGIECPRLTSELKNARVNLGHNWKMAGEAAPGDGRINKTVTGQHALTWF